MKIMQKWKKRQCLYRQYNSIIKRYNRQLTKLKSKVIIGANIKIIKFEKLGITVSFAKSLNASAKACKRRKYLQR